MECSPAYIPNVQEQDLVDAKVEIEKGVLAAVSRVEQFAQQHSGGTGPQEQRVYGEDRDGPKLNDACKNEVSELTDSMSKAAFVIWIYKMDLFLEEFSDFGIGTN